MSKEIITRVRENVADAEQSLATAKDLIQRLRKAGEDVSELERQQQRIEQRIRRYKQAFAE